MRSTNRKTSTRAPARVPQRRRPRSQADIENRLETLHGLQLDGARWAWRETMGRPAPANLSRGFLIRYLAYQLQAKAFGDLDRRHRDMLSKLAQGDMSVVAASVGRGMNLQLGTVLVREYRGELHQVTVTENGFAWRGKTFPSLSGVASAITGVNWNGYAFFGLKQKIKDAKGDG